jgi:hypothetical protein
VTATVSPTGCGTALATPFTRSGAIDEAALRSFVDWQIDEGIDFLVPCGSTGEAATMSLAEHRRVVEIVVEQARGRVPVVAGAGSNDTQKAIALSRELKDAGATHLLHVAPMYSRPPQRGMSLHFAASPTRSICRRSCTTCRAAPGSTSKRPPRSSSRSTRASSARRKPRVSSRRSPISSWDVPTGSPSSRATTR